MRPKNKKDIGQLILDDELIDGALTQAVREALLRHKRAGHPIAVWQNGQVVWIPPEEIVIPPAPPGFET